MERFRTGNSVDSTAPDDYGFCRVLPLFSLAKILAGRIGSFDLRRFFHVQSDSLFRRFGWTLLAGLLAAFMSLSPLRLMRLRLIWLIMMYTLNILSILLHQPRPRYAQAILFRLWLL